MKKIYNLLLLSTLLLFGASNAWADVIYVYNIPSGWGSGMDASDANIYGYFYGDGEAWSSPATLVAGSKYSSSAIYAITIPSGGTWTKLILTRGTAPAFDGRKYNQSKGMVLPTDGKNYLSSYTMYSSADGDEAPGNYTWSTFNGKNMNWSIASDTEGFSTQAFVRNAVGDDFAVITATLNAGTAYDFYLFDGVSTYLKNTGTMSINHSYRWEMTTEANVNAHITPSVTGSYMFIFEFSSHRTTVIYPQSRTVGSGYFGTICVPVDATISNATLYTIEGKNDAGTKLYIAAETGDAATHLTAGTPYFFLSSGASQTVTLGSTSFATTAATVNGFVGSFVKTEVAEGNYVLSNVNTLLVSPEGGCYIASNRAYVNLTSVEPVMAPGRPIIEINLGTGEATSINNIGASEEAIKFFQNGKLFIQKNGIVYDMMGGVVR